MIWYQLRHPRALIKQAGRREHACMKVNFKCKYILRVGGNIVILGGDLKLRGGLNRNYFPTPPPPRRVALKRSINHLFQALYSTYRITTVKFV